MTANTGNTIIEMDYNDYDDGYDNSVFEEAEMRVSPVQSKSTERSITWTVVWAIKKTFFIKYLDNDNETVNVTGLMKILVQY